MAKKFWIPVAAGISALALVGSLGVANALHKHDVTVVVDGVEKTIAVREDTVAEVLDLEGITVGEHDVVRPGPDTKVSQDMEIVISWGRPLEVTVDGETREVWTTAQTVGEALAYLDLDASDSKFSASRSTAIGREGLAVEIATAKDVTLTVAGQPSQLTIAGTVADALAEVGVTPDADDLVSPEPETVLTDGLQITYVNVTQESRTEMVPIAFEKSEVKSDTLLKGKSEVTTKGVEGAHRETWTDTFEDGVLVDSTLAEKVVSVQPVHQVTTVGTKEPEPDPEPVATTSTPSTASSSSDLTPATGNTCKASYYWQGQKTANGEQFNTNDFTSAHKTLPFNTRVKVTNLANGKTTTVRINDRGPYISGRCLDLSTAAMSAIGGTSAGVINVAWEVVG